MCTSLRTRTCCKLLEARDTRLVVERYTIWFTDDYKSSFHITTAYGILRMKGVDVGKLDFLNGAGLINIETVEN
jgi:hypothetical protein